MASVPRAEIIYDGCSFHLTWQCHNHEWFLEDDWAKKLYYRLLLKYKDKYGVQFHSYQLMENHPHLTGTIKDREKFSGLFRVVNNVFAKKVNQRLGRRGQVVMDRFKSPRIQDDRHMLNVMSYSDLNGVRCGRDKRASDAKWSSYRYYAYGKKDPLITPATSYLALGKSPKQRQRAYREMVHGVLLHRKFNYSKICFIGDPDWVRDQYEMLKEHMRALVAKREEHRQTLHATDPP